jgi:hypothetical protein
MAPVRRVALFRRKGSTNTSVFFLLEKSTNVQLPVSFLPIACIAYLPMEALISSEKSGDLYGLIPHVIIVIRHCCKGLISNKFSTHISLDYRSNKYYYIILVKLHSDNNKGRYALHF